MLVRKLVLPSSRVCPASFLPPSLPPSWTTLFDRRRRLSAPPLSLAVVAKRCTGKQCRPISDVCLRKGVLLWASFEQPCDRCTIFICVASPDNVVYILYLLPSHDYYDPFVYIRILVFIYEAYNGPNADLLVHHEASKLDASHMLQCSFSTNGFGCLHEG